jgi:hypothetical protein
MPGPVVTQASVVQCAHGGRATPASTFPRVLVAGAPVAVQPVPFMVVGCTLPPPSAGNGPCVTAPWVTGSLRVLAGGMPLVLLDSQAIAVPTGTPLLVAATQPRVTAT